jgi:hypothetical protein
MVCAYRPLFVRCCFGRPHDSSSDSIKGHVLDEVMLERAAAGLEAGAFQRTRDADVCS